MSNLKDLFIVDVGVERTFDFLSVAYPKFAWLTSGPLGKSLRAAAKFVLGKAIGEGIIKADLSIDSIIFAYESGEYQARARQLYEKAQKKVYTDEEKQAIRLEYARLLKLAGRLRKRN